jgi:hypothetical protein
MLPVVSAAIGGLLFSWLTDPVSVGLALGCC